MTTTSPPSSSFSCFSIRLFVEICTHVFEMFFSMSAFDRSRTFLFEVSLLKISCSSRMYLQGADEKKKIITFLIFFESYSANQTLFPLRFLLFLRRVFIHCLSDIEISSHLSFLLFLATLAIFMSSRR